MGSQRAEHNWAIKHSTQDDRKGTGKKMHIGLNRGVCSTKEWTLQNLFAFNHHLLANPWFLTLLQILLIQAFLFLLPLISIHLGFLPTPTPTPCWNIYDWVACSDFGHAFISLCTLSISFVAFSSTALSCFISLSTYPLLPKLALLKFNVFSFPFCCGFNSLWYKHNYY